jgi:succinyl-diaminopimelate desuccinylase
LSDFADPLGLARELIARASVTPEDDGVQALLGGWLEALGFSVTHLRFGDTPNLFASIGAGHPHFCFAGHTDVVPPGDAPWSSPPFAASLREDVLIGRGATDMKGAIAAFVAASARHLAAGPPRGRISLLITGDEEGAATDGTVRVLPWMAEHGAIPDFCLVGEPTNPATLGEVIKIGRRGSLNARIVVHGTQGHAAYPQRADNPTHRLLAALSEMLAAPLDDGTDWFEPSSLQVTSLDVGNPTFNIIPAAASARLNIRFNDRHSGASLSAWLRDIVARHAPRGEVEITISGEAFLTRPGADVDRLSAAIAGATGVIPRLDTGGGTSDARFIALYCPVAEFGLVGATMHQADERVPVAELRGLTEAYLAILAAFLP